MQTPMNHSRHDPRQGQGVFHKTGCPASTRTEKPRWAAEGEVRTASEEFFHKLAKGGRTMIALLACSVMGGAFAIERFFKLRRNAIVPRIWARGQPARAPHQRRAARARGCPTRPTVGERPAAGREARPASRPAASRPCPGGRSSPTAWAPTGCSSIPGIAWSSPTDQALGGRAKAKDKWLDCSAGVNSKSGRAEEHAMDPIGDGLVEEARHVEEPAGLLAQLLEHQAQLRPRGR